MVTKKFLNRHTFSFTADNGKNPKPSLDSVKINSKSSRKEFEELSVRIIFIRCKYGNSVFISIKKNRICSYSVPEIDTWNTRGSLRIFFIPLRSKMPEVLNEL